MAVRFYQVGSFAVGNRLVNRSDRTVQSDAERANSLTSGHRACQGCGEALGARYALDAAMRATGGQMVAVNATGCLEVFSTPYPETSWQIAWFHSLFGNAPAVATGVAAALRVKGRGRHQGGRPGRRRRHGGHRLRLPVGHVRAQRRRPVHLLRQRGLHEHRRAAVGGDPAGGAHGDDRGGRPPSGERLRPGQEPARAGHGTPDPLRGHRDGGRPARPRGQGHPGHGDPRRPLHPHPGDVPARLGLGTERHGQGRPAGHPDRPLPRVRGRARRGRAGVDHPPAGPGRGVPAPAEPLRPPLRRGGEPGAARRDRRPAGHGRPQHRAATGCSSPRRWRP